MESVIKDKHLRLPQDKIEKAKKILGAKTETEAIERALEMIIQGDKAAITRRRIKERILLRRKKIGKIPEDVSEWVRQTRVDREKAYAG